MAFDLDSQIERLKSPKPDEQVAALDAMVEIISGAVEKAVEAMEGPNDFLIAERLQQFGTLAVTPLERILNETRKTDVRILASLVLLQLGSKVGVPNLLEAIRNSSDYSCLAAKHLVKAGIVEAAESMITRLRSTKLDDIDLILCLLQRLKDLGSEVPPDLRSRLSNPDVPEWLKVGLRTFSLL